MPKEFLRHEPSVTKDPKDGSRDDNQGFMPELW
jgi:hypothetical protein